MNVSLPLSLTPVPCACRYCRCPTLFPQTLEEQVTRYFHDIVDYTDETLGESRSVRTLYVIRYRVFVLVLKQR